jgi:hypothetical protein
MRAIPAGGSGDGTGYAVESHAVALCFTTPAQQRAVAEFLNRNEAAS